MANVEHPGASAATGGRQSRQHPSKQDERRHRSIFDVPADFFDSCRLLQSPSSISLVEPLENLSISAAETSANGDEVEREREEGISSKNSSALQKWSCNTCKAEFDSLQDQRSHFKSDIHRFNIKLSIAGKDTIKEEDFDELTADSLFKDDDISSISGSEDEDTKEISVSRLDGSMKRKIFVQLRTGERVSVWKCLVLDELENILYENDKSITMDDDAHIPCLTETEVIKKLKYLIHEPRDNSQLRVVLLAKGGHFAGCVFDGHSVVAHKTFHRYVIRAKAGKKQSSKDASGKTVHSAGASLRRYNELALKKDILELLASWKPYFDVSSCIFIHAPSSNRQLLFDGDKPYFSCQHRAIRNVPIVARRPTFKEARRIFTLLTQVSHEVDEEVAPKPKEDSILSSSVVRTGGLVSDKDNLRNDVEGEEIAQACSSVEKIDNVPTSSETETEFVGTSTPLHEAAKTANAQRVLELLEQGMDPCTRDERGRTPYILANEKEVRNTFRRFMALNLEKWDWHAANVPSALTKEMEESQAAKQAEKDAKKKARAKEMKKLKKAREREAQAQAAHSQNASTISGNSGATSSSSLNGKAQSSFAPRLSKEHVSKYSETRFQFSFLGLKRTVPTFQTEQTPNIFPYTAAPEFSGSALLHQWISPFYMEELRQAQEEEREKRAAAAERRLAAATGAKPPGSGSSGAPSGSQPKGVLTTDIRCSCCNASLLGKIPFHRYNYKYCSTSCMHVHKEIIEDE